MSSPGAKRYLARLGKAVIAVEIGCLIGAYGVWHKMNTSQDYRKSVQEKYPSVLEMFYYSAETFAGNSEVRRSDCESWGVAVEE